MRPAETALPRDTTPELQLVSGGLLPLPRRMLLALWGIAGLVSLAGFGSYGAHAFARHPLVGRTSDVASRAVPSGAGPHFSPAPSDAEFLRAGAFTEPLVPVHPTDAKENRDLARALVDYVGAARRRGRDAVEPILDFLAVHPESAWRPALLVNLGAVYRQTGHLSKALSTWQAAWDSAKRLDDARGRSLGDLALARLSQFEAYLGRKELLAPLLDEARGRDLGGTAAELVSESSSGLAEMRDRPEVAFKCGPMALKRLLLHRGASPSAASMQLLERARSTPDGLPLNTVWELSQQAGMQYQMAFRAPGAPRITPAVVHWKVGHYAALVGEAEGHLLVEDPTFVDSLRIVPETLDEEASGYFLVPSGPLPEGWRTVDGTEAGQVWGRGDTGPFHEDQATGAGVPMADIAPNKCGGCTTWNVEAMVVGLSLHDTPVGYSPPVGPAVRFELQYSHRDALQPHAFSYLNFGRKWTNNWLSYVTDNISTNLSAGLYQRGGGAESYAFASAGDTTSSAGRYSQALLTRTVDASGQTTGFTLKRPDGSSDVFGQAFGNQFFMTALVDPRGNEVTIQYDGQMRIRSITDALGQATTLSYELASDPLKVTKVTDPFGRSASFTYNAAGDLASITDVLGITSAYSYGPGDFVNTLQTPYGTTHFVFGDSTTNPALGSTRVLLITDALGRTSRVEYRQAAPGINTYDPAPQGVRVNDSYLEYRNTFIWNATQYAAASQGGALDYTQATILHWLHTADETAASRVVESSKAPLEGRVWYDYPGQPDPPLSVGTSDQPLHVGQVLDDGTTHLWSYQYNALGRVTETVDPMGRIYLFTYDTNGVDLRSVANISGGSMAVLLTATSNSQHEPLTVTGADGATTRYQYNAAGQLTQITDALGNSTSYSYDKSGYLTAVQAPLGSRYSFTYDGLGRVASVTDAAGATVTYAYDAADRPTTIGYPDGSQAALRYQLLDLAAMTDRLGRTTTLHYDAERQLTQVVDALGQAVTFDYSPSGQLSSITDANGHVTRVTRDQQDRVVSKQFADGTSEAVTYEQSTGRLQSATDALGQTATYSYNADDTLASATYGGTTADTTAPAVHFTYDKAYRRLTSTTDGIGTTTYDYYPVGGTAAPGAGRLRSVSSPVAGAPGVTDTVSFAYDLLGRVSGQTVNGVEEAVTFDPLGRVTTVSNALDVFTFRYEDATARVTGVASGQGPQASFSYFGPKGNELLKQAIFSGASGQPLAEFDYTHDGQGNVATFTRSYLGQKLEGMAGNGGAGGGLIPPLLKGLDQGSGRAGQRPAVPPGALLAVGAGLLLALILLGRGFARRTSAAVSAVTATLLAFLLSGCGQPDGAGNPAIPIATASLAPATVTYYAYDAVYRLVSAAVATRAGSPPPPQFLYQYDPASNLTSMTGGAQGPQLASTSTNALASGSYDADGSPLALDGTTYRWDSQNRLISAANGDRESDFTYDGFGRLVRIVEKRGGAIASDKAYTWCGDVRCLERDNTESGSPVHKRYFDEGVQIDGQNYYYVADHLGSVRQVVDLAGTLRASYEYDPYGNRTKMSGDLDSDLGYAGYFHHQSTGLELALFRAYDPRHGRWLNRDPLGEGGGNNLYGYVGGDPINRVDPSGLQPTGAGDADWLPGVPADRITTSPSGLVWADTGGSWTFPVPQSDSRPAAAFYFSAFGLDYANWLDAPGEAIHVRRAGANYFGTHGEPGILGAPCGPTSCRSSRTVARPSSPLASPARRIRATERSAPEPARPTYLPRKSASIQPPSTDARPGRRRATKDRPFASEAVG